MNKCTIKCLHESAYAGLLAEEMPDVGVAGAICATPGAPKVLEALQAMNRPAGILFVGFNHAGGVMSANMAMQMAEREGIKVQMFLLSSLFQKLR